MMGTAEKKLSERISRVLLPDHQAEQACRKHWDTLAKPLDGMGRFEELLIRLAGIQKSGTVFVRPAGVVIMCGDHGVTEENVTQTDSSVTISVAQALVKGRSTVNVMAEAAGADVFAVDMGIKVEEPIEGTLYRSGGKGTKNFLKEPAMTREQVCEAILTGIEVVEMLAKKGYRLLAAGEMGIGNTTSASAMMSALSGMDAASVTGRGAGLPDDRLAHKIEVVRKAVRLHQPDPEDPIEVLACLGGFEIAGMTGMYIGGALTGTAIVIDGVISGMAALLATMICPECAGFMIASHQGREPSSAYLMELLKLKPVLHADMALGEATGAVMLFPLLDVALALYNNGETFEEIEVESYERFSK